MEYGMWQGLAGGYLLIGRQQWLDQERGSEDWCSQGLAGQAGAGEGYTQSMEASQSTCGGMWPELGLEQPVVQAVMPSNLEGEDWPRKCQ